ncbi:endophilin-A [Paragonimus westermani]|uniref:Endophilin-A n=1 Tax=Paragonimus westermani TaxID=34504 RepID=A0A5J4NHA6_9TREM|nr:endophilin-A [Paragonimus westermani]
MSVKLTQVQVVSFLCIDGLRFFEEENSYKQSGKLIYCSNFLKALSEKLHKSKKAPGNEDYKQLSSLIDSYKHYFEEVRKRSTECLEPGTNFRIRPTNNSHGSHNNPAKETYPHAELLLAQCFAKYAKEFGLESPLGSTLMCVSEGYGQLTEAKNRAAEETQTRFVLPITETLGQEIKEIIHLRKKAESRRLAYEVERNRVQKGKNAPSAPQYIEAEQKFHEAHQAAHLAMSNFLESEAEHIEMISNFVTAQLGYVQDAQRVLTDLQSRIQQK